MGYRVDLKGKKFGRLTVIEFAGNERNGSAMWACKCDCGNVIKCRGNSITSGNTYSCGCYSREVTKNTNRKDNVYEFDGDVGMCFLNGGNVAYFDKEDFDKIKDYGWSFDGENRYVSARDRKTGKSVRMHRVIMGFPKSGDIDHINHNKLDNRKSNLRICTRSQNMMNSKISKRNNTGYKGVYKKGGKFTAAIRVNGKSISLGSFSNPEDASKARIEAEKKYYGEYAFNEGGCNK